MAIDQSINSLLNSAQVTIDNALNNPEIQAYLNEYNYTAERIQTGKTLYETALAAQQKQQAEYGEQLSATAALNEARSIAHKSYMRLVKIARIAFKNNPGIATELGLNGRRKKSLSGWLLQAQQFYTNALNSTEVMNGLAEYGITEEKLKAAQTEMLAVEAANNAQEQEKGEAQDATKQRDQAIDLLDDWLSDFIAIARIALEDRPQLLEILGIQAD
ncbi:MAG: hypothetical protein AAFO04_21035 [Cyanobacteria bacterium J06592_8]